MRTIIVEYVSFSVIRFATVHYTESFNTRKYLLLYKKYISFNEANRPIQTLYAVTLSNIILYNNIVYNNYRV